MPDRHADKVGRIVRQLRAHRGDRPVTDPRNLFRDVYTKMCKAAMGVR